jgi:prephenate dehydrogenase
MKTQTIAIIGLGREGSSVGLALKQSFPSLRFIGHDPERKVAEASKNLGAVDKVEWNLLNACAQADIIVLNVPLADLKDTLRNIGGDVQEHALILDMGLLKSAGLKWADEFVQRGHYVGVRPILAADFLADGRSSLAAASPDMYRNSVFCLMPSVHADPQAVETAVNVGLALGASPYFLDATEFDNLVQGVETTPRLLAAAMFSVLHKAAGWRDILRFAGLPFSLSTLALESDREIAHLVHHDKEATMRWLDSLITELQEIRRWVYHEEEEVLGAMLENLSIERDKWVLNRRDNDWVEVKTPDLEMPSMGQQLFGGLAGRRPRKDED